MQKPQNTQSNTPHLYDWLLLVSIILIGGSSFALIKTALLTMPPVIIAVGRLWVATIALLVFMVATGRRFPAFIILKNKKKNINPIWKYMIGVGSIGNTLPFFLFPWAQQYVPSGLAGVYMALMPIWTLGLAALFAGEALTGKKLTGFLLGFIGVIILMAPALKEGLGTTEFSHTVIYAQLALVLATLLYATSAVIVRRAPEIRPRIFSAGLLLSAAVTATPALFLVSWQYDQWSFVSIASVLALGLLPTALGAIIIVIIIQRMGAGFMSYSNYLTPVWAIILGAILFHERLSLNVFIALAVIITGLIISQTNIRKR